MKHTIIVPLIGMPEELALKGETQTLCIVIYDARSKEEALQIAMDIEDMPCDWSFADVLEGDYTVFEGAGHGEL